MQKEELIQLIESLEISRITYFSMNYKNISDNANIKEINWNDVEE